MTTFRTNTVADGDLGIEIERENDPLTSQTNALLSVEHDKID